MKMVFEHFDITRICQYGYADRQSCEAECKNCNERLFENQQVCIFQDEVFCDMDCLIESFSDNPFSYGATNEVL